MVHIILYPVLKDLINNSVAYSVKYQIDLLLSAAVLFKIQGKAIFRYTDFARR